jgi:hypothetical protein
MGSAFARGRGLKRDRTLPSPSGSTELAECPTARQALWNTWDLCLTRVDSRFIVPIGLHTPIRPTHPFPRLALKRRLFYKGASREKSIC